MSYISRVGIASALPIAQMILAGHKLYYIARDLHMKEAFQRMWLFQSYVTHASQGYAQRGIQIDTLRPSDVHMCQ